MPARAGMPRPRSDFHKRRLHTAVCGCGRRAERHPPGNRKSEIGNRAYSTLVRLRQRITLPFVLLFVAAYVATALVVISLVAGAVERRLIDQTENLAKVMTGFPGPQARDVIKRAYDAEAWFFENGALLPGQPGTPPAFRRDEHALQENGAVYAKIAGDRELVMVYDPALVAREKSDAVRPVVAVAAVALVLVIVFGVATARTVSGKPAAPSSFTMSAPPSFTMRIAALTAASVPSCSGPNGKSQLTSARDTPRRTARQARIIWSSVTSRSLS